MSRNTTLAHAALGDLSLLKQVTMVVAGPLLVAVLSHTDGPLGSRASQIVQAKLLSIGGSPKNLISNRVGTI